MKAEKKSTTGSARDKNNVQAVKLLDTLMAEREPQIPDVFIERVEQDFAPSGALSVCRRVALVYLGKTFEETAAGICNNRDFAVASADAANRIHESIEKYKLMANLLTTAEIRIRLALARREDILEILDEAKA